MIIHLGDVNENLLHDLENAFERIGLTSQLSKVSKVFVKPNFTYPRYVPGVTTSPEFLAAVIRIASNQGTEILVGESNGGYGSFRAAEAFVGHRLREICNETKATAVNLSEQESREYTRTVGGRETKVILPRFLAEEVDLTISVPVLKVHVMTTVSLSVKNLWGCCPLDLRLLQHAQLDRKLQLITELTKARFALIDATYGLDKHGPMDGEARHIGRFIAANDLYGVDWITAQMMGFNPRAIQHLQMISKATKLDVTLKRVNSNTDFSAVNWGFSLGFNLIDTLSFASFHSDALARLVFDSPLTRPIYAVFGKTPRKKLQ